MSNAVSDSPEIPPGQAITIEDIRWRYCHIKSTSLLANVLLKQAAAEQGMDEALLVSDGLVSEGAASNLFMVKNNTILTPAKSEHLLPGITRDLVLELARAHGLACIERDISEIELAAADEIWITSSTKEIQAITRLNGKPVNNGEIGPLWHQIIALYREYKANLAKES
jgi:D-alanine transaminase